MIGLVLASMLAVSCPGETRDAVLHRYDELYVANVGTNFVMKSYEGKDAVALAKFVAEDAGNPDVSKATEVDIYIGKKDGEYAILLSFQDGACNIISYWVGYDKLKEIVTKAIGQDV